MHIAQGSPVVYSVLPRTPAIPYSARQRRIAIIPPCAVGSSHTLDEAIVRANKTPFGLSGSVWSRDTEKALAVARSIEAGQVWVNTHGVLAINHLAPYGGVKQSGIGRKSGIEGILEYVQSQTITTYEHA